MVGDWMDIGTLIEAYLVKQTLPRYMETYRWERCRDTGNANYQLTDKEIADIKKCHTKFLWEDNEFVTFHDVKAGSYAKKKIIYLAAKPRGIKTWDRTGNLTY